MAIELKRCPICGEKRFVFLEAGCCFDCEAEYIVTGKPKLPRRGSPMPGRCPERKKDENRKPTLENPVLKLDFSEYPEIFDRLCRAARADFRTPELEVLWLLDQHLPRDSG
ncbi:hypothetical protein [Thermosulfurimonas sp. F29]|uniref:hypothetical protein n=1 Tax=Thermosulfurimonas sp. F29 TaxID=2867247 RepID=UPI001C829FEF|nr:hypothetical protein [Thermosulfurimonas sp. F29]MBX6423323.1 hypothetical protein [Thermosulfurimonas sp. F29]